MDAKTNGALGAYPETVAVDGSGAVYSGACGLTKRELFAAMAMQGLLSSAIDGTWDAFAQSAVNSADALLAALPPESAP